ncbi:MAG: 4-hydroxy-tetrahydrodipicolinate synthase [Acidimicrobiales bacterium]|nr:4-hydroxy-tetrahydrodipicolinate synthase [Acidimicrobiales bacterium]
MARGRFGKVLTAMVTPFTDAGDLDLDGAVTLARWLLAHGSDGLVLAGTTGEGPTLSDDEKVELWTAVRAAVDAPLLAGSGSNDTRHTRHLSERAAAAGVDGLLVVAPYYNKPSQAGMEAHFRAVAEATRLPIVVYDIPGRTGRKVDTDVLVRLAQDVPTIVGVKDAAGNPGETARLVAAAPADFDVLSGDDPMTLPLLAVGASGVVGTATHWCGEVMADLIASFEKGDHDRARELNASLFESYAYESRDSAQFALAVKVALRCLGLPSGPCRLPLGPEPPELEAEAGAMLDRLGRPTAGGAA